MDELSPFIVTSWYGHRDDSDIPAPVRAVWSEKFGSRRGPAPKGQSNVDLAILDPTSRVVHHFDGFPRTGRGPLDLGAYTLEQVREGIDKLNEVPPKTKPSRVALPKTEPRPLVLPDIADGEFGVRVIVQLLDDRMRAYRAPIVEAVPQKAKDLRALARPKKPRELDASELATWLSELYPPGIMERTNPKTKEAYRVASVSGTLRLTPIDAADGHSRAILSGTIQLTDEGPDDFTWEGELDLLLTYERRSSKLHTLRGVFEGTYPRYDRRRNEARLIPLVAVFESRPD